MFEKNEQLLMPHAGFSGRAQRVEATAAALAHSLLAERMANGQPLRDDHQDRGHAILDAFWPEIVVLRTDPMWSDVVDSANDEFDRIIREVEGKSDQQLLAETGSPEIQHDERVWDRLFASVFERHDALIRGWADDLAAHGVPLVGAPTMPQHRLMGMGFGGSGHPSLKGITQTLDAVVPDQSKMEVYNLGHPSLGPGLVHRFAPDGNAVADGTRLFEIVKGVEGLIDAAPDDTGVYLAWEQAENGKGAVPSVLLFWPADVVDDDSRREELLSMTRSLLGMRNSTEDPRNATLNENDEAYVSILRARLSTLDVDFDHEDEDAPGLAVS